MTIKAQRYTVYIERDSFPDPERYPDGIAWRSGILDEDGQDIDGNGDIATWEEARDLALSTLGRLFDFGKTPPDSKDCL